MINLVDNERVVITLHKHWFDMIGTIIVLCILLAAPLMFLPFINKLQNYINGSSAVFVLFFLVLYWMVLLLLFFIKWIEYWLDMWIITNKRIIYIEQTLLFKRRVSEFYLSRVQDVTVKINGIMATFFRFGSLSVQTAGEKSFNIKNISQVERAQAIILKEVSKLQNKNVRTF